MLVRGSISDRTYWSGTEALVTTGPAVLTSAIMETLLAEHRR